MKITLLTREEKKRCKILFYLLLFIALFSFYSANAQLTGWKYKDAIKVQENAGTQMVNYQVLLSINTQALISAGKMDTTGKDLRFSKNCTGSVLMDYWIESGINTANTQIWVRIDTLPANGSKIFYMYYGNNAATAASNFNNTFPVSSQLIVNAGSVTLTGTNNFSWFEIQAGASVIVTPNSPLVINSRVIKIAGTLNGDGAGYLGGVPAANGSGPGAGTVSTGNLGTNGGGGAGYGGAGGSGGGAATTTYAQTGIGGVSYGVTGTDSINMGSGGGASSVNGGNGGASITLKADIIDISGTVTAKGADGVLATLNGGSGAGSGGGILIKGNKVAISGSLAANGGTGGEGAYSGGGGGGGRIKIFSDASISNTGTLSVAGGSIGPQNTGVLTATAGTAGTTFTDTYTSGIATYSFLPHVVLTSSNTTVCQGTSINFTASSGFNNYNFVADTSLQDSSINTFSSSTLNDGDSIRVLASDINGCIDTSNIIPVEINPNPVISVTPDVATICDGNSVMLMASGADTYNWGPSTGLNTTSGDMVTASPSSTETYTVTGTTTSSGCSGDTTVTVNVTICTGIASINNFNFNAYPNPNNGLINIEMNITDKANIVLELSNILGEKIQTIEQSSFSGTYKKQLNINFLEDGVYFITLKTDHATVVKKVIKN